MVQNYQLVLGITPELFGMSLFPKEIQIDKKSLSFSTAQLEIILKSNEHEGGQ